MKRQHPSPRPPKSHLTYKQRCIIEALLKEGASFRYIAESIGKSPSTVSREIRKHTVIYKSNRNDCINRPMCDRHRVCGSTICRKMCHNCNKCKNFCPDYKQAACEFLTDSNFLCNSCNKQKYCQYSKRLYHAETAQRAYRETLVGMRDGFDLSL